MSATHTIKFYAFGQVSEIEVELTDDNQPILPFEIELADDGSVTVHYDGEPDESYPTLSECCEAHWLDESVFNLVSRERAAEIIAEERMAESAVGDVRALVVDETGNLGDANHSEPARLFSEEAFRAQVVAWRDVSSDGTEATSSKPDDEVTVFEQIVKAMDGTGKRVRSRVLAMLNERYCECGGRQDDACIEEPVVPLGVRCRCVLWADED